MTIESLSNDERRCLQMWFRQAIVQLERQEALSNITKFYAGDTKARDAHHAAVGNRRPARSARHEHKELV